MACFLVSLIHEAFTANLFCARRCCLRLPSWASATEHVARVATPGACRARLLPGRWGRHDPCPSWADSVVLARLPTVIGFCLQIRKDALRALNVAYTVSTQRATAFPLDGVVRMLLFRDCEEATDFLSYHGLAVADG